MKQKKAGEPAQRDMGPPKRQKPLALLVGILSILVSFFAAFLIWVEQAHYESGILDVCATQQDAYVQLVLDQINLKENRSDEEIITGILSTLDASSNKYWTFSKEQAMLFVKDVLETNKYKGFTTATYYSSESAQAFLQSLQVNRVIHGEIEINEAEYIASGVAFEYCGETYRICLLTNRRVLLDNNHFLESKVGLCITVAVLLFLFCITALSMGIYIQKLLAERESQKQLVAGLNRSLVSVNERLSDKDLYDVRNNLWKRNALSEFMGKLVERKVFPFTVVKLGFSDNSRKRAVLELSQSLMDKSVLKFEWGDMALVMLFVQADPEAVNRNIIPLLTLPGTDVLYRCQIEEDREGLVENIIQKLQGDGE